MSHTAMSQPSFYVTFIKNPTGFVQKAGAS